MIGLTAPKTIAQEAYIYALPMVMAYGIMYGYPPKAGRFREFCRCVFTHHKRAVPGTPAGWCVERTLRLLPRRPGLSGYPYRQADLGAKLTFGYKNTLRLV